MLLSTNLVQMANSIRRNDYMTKIKGSGNWYLQFYIKPDYRSLPFFKKTPKWNTRRNYLETLKTPNYQEASSLALKRLQEIGIKERNVAPELVTGGEAFFSVLQDLKTRDDKELKQLHDAYETFRDNAISEKYTGDIEIGDEVSFDHYSKAVEAVERELIERNIPFYSQPYPYEVTLKQMAEHYRNEIVEDGADLKTQSKLHHAVRKLLEFRQVSDLELRLIKPKLIADYVRKSRQTEVAEGTIRSELAALSNVWKYGLRNEYLQRGINPFANVHLKGFKKKISRKPFNAEMLDALLKASKPDADMEQLIMCSYYTGMRLSEVFSAKFIVVDEIACFNVASDGGKTEAARRLIPIHDNLQQWLDVRYLSAENAALTWTRATHDAVGKKFGRLKDTVLEQVGINDPEQKKEYVHHSFRHGFVTMLIEAGFYELEFADLTGHSKSFLGRTEAGRTYASTAKLEKLQNMILTIPIMVK